MARKTLPPLLEGWINALKDKSVSIWIRDNSCRELMEVRDQIDEAVRLFITEKNRIVTSQAERRRR